MFALQNYDAKCLRLGKENDANFGFFGPVLFRGHFEEIGKPIAKVLLILSHVAYMWESFRDVGFSKV